MENRHRLSSIFTDEWRGFYIRSVAAPPQHAVAETSFVKKPAYVELRNMILVRQPKCFDNAVWRQQNWRSTRRVHAADCRDPTERYKSYLNLLARIGAKSVSKDQTGSEVCIGVWRMGMGDTIHVWVWLVKMTRRQQSTKGPIDGVVYYPLGAKWYVCQDYTW